MFIFLHKSGRWVALVEVVNILLLRKNLHAEFFELATIFPLRS